MTSQIRRPDPLETRARELATIAGLDLDARQPMADTGRTMPVWCGFRPAVTAEHNAAKAAVLVAETPPQPAAYGAVSAMTLNPLNLRYYLIVAVSDALRASGLSTKVLARRVCADPRAVENWRDASTAPRAEHLLALMASDPTIEAEVLRLVRETRDGSL